MSKRFIDTDLVRKVWFRKLTPVQKCLFVYLFTCCDCAGVIEKDLDGMSFAIGQKVTEKDLEILSDQVLEIAGNKLYLPDFVSFQYGELSPSCKPHAAVIKLLQKYDLNRLSKGLGKGIQRVSDTLVDKDKDKDKDKEGIVKGVEMPDCLSSVEGFADTFNAFLDSRKALKKPATIRAQNLILKDLSERPLEACAALNMAIKKGWQGIEWAWYDKYNQENKQSVSTHTPVKPSNLTAEENAILIALRNVVPQRELTDKTDDAKKETFSMKLRLHELESKAAQ